MHLAFLHNQPWRMTMQTIEAGYVVAEVRLLFTAIINGSVIV